MLQISNCRLFFLSTSRSSFPLTRPVKKPFLSSSSSPLFNPKTPIKPSSFPTVFSSSFRRERNNNNNNNHSLRSGSRNKSTIRDNNKGRKEKADLKMEESSSGFNKRRAEGKDKDDRPKTLQLKVRKLNPINTISYVQILGTGMDTQDTSPSVFLFFDKQRFIFNSGEGLQRFCTEHKIKLSKIDHIFFSRVCSETAGGLPGLLLTLAGMGEEGMSVKIWGSSDLKYLVDAMRSFIPNAAMVHTHSFGPTPNADGAALSGLEKITDPIVLLDDEVVKISAVLLWPSCSKASQLMDDGSFMSNSLSMGSEVKRNQLFGVLLPHTKNQERREGSVLKPGDISVIYVCELPEIKGKFDPAKAVALGLKPGPKYRELQLGNSVMSDRRNIMVHPSDVLGPSIPGPIVIIVDCPTPSHLQELLSIQSLNNYYADSADKQGGGPKSVNCVIHLSPSSVTMTSDYQNWMRRFVGAQHIMAGHEIKNMEIPILKSSARIAARLNYVCPQFFPAPGVWSAQQHTHSTSESNALSEGIFPKNSESILAENLLKFHLRPYTQLGLDKSGIPSVLSSTDIVNELVAEIPEISDAVEQVNELWRSPTETGNLVLSKNEDVVMTEEPWMNAEASIPNINLGKQVNGESGEMQLPFSNSMRRDEVEHDSNLPSCLDNISREDLEIVLLGTGSSQPSKYRNVSSVFVNLFSKGTLLLDCGEGTLGQLRRRFGVKGADKAIRNLRFIWISHIHADHHSGLARILALRQELLRDVPHEPLLVIGPRQLKRFLDAYQRLETLDMQFLDCRNTTEASWTAFEEGNQCDQESAVASGKINKKNEAGGIAQNIEMSLFAKGSRMQSYWKTPGSPVDFAAGFEILRKLEVVLGEAGLEVLTSIPVVHCPQAFGVVIKASERINTAGKIIPGWKLVYSGDTRPCPELIDASRGATILIHEATFEDGMVEEAIAKNHSTTKEAIEVGDSAGAYRIILTHFSQRYPKIPVLNEIHMHKTCIGFDLMSINIADLPVLPRVLPYLKLLFRNDMAFDESDGVADPSS